jgi:hypothetical protein
MATVKVSNQIAAPVEEVFQIFTDIEHGVEHVSGIAKIEMLTTGGFSLGTRWRETREILGRLDDAEMEVTAFELNRMTRLAFASTRSSRSNQFLAGQKSVSNSGWVITGSPRGCCRRSSGRSRARFAMCSPEISAI